ncbi:MAG: hypothetical protein NZ749_14650 [bacterium]|nr:hypothetical protein [bacterium]
MQRHISPTTVVLVLVVAVVLVGIVWAYLQYSLHTKTETTRTRVEQELYREGELGHPPSGASTQPAEQR